MKKILAGIGILFGIILVLWIVGRLTGMLQWYTISSPVNEPTLKQGDKVFTTNLKKAKPGDFIAFTSRYQDSLAASYTENYKFGSRYMFRLCAVGGNSIEMKNGVLYVDRENFDEELNLKNEFEISATAFNDIIREEDKIEGSYRSVYPAQDSILIALSRAQIKKYQSKLKLTPFIVKDTANGPFKWLDKNATWTIDNFGPLSIPPGYNFVLGDNRHNALDSRYTGFIRDDDIKGVVLNK